MDTEITPQDPTLSEFMELYHKLTPEERVEIRAKISRMAMRNPAAKSSMGRDALASFQAAQKES